MPNYKNPQIILSALVKQLAKEVAIEVASAFKQNQDQIPNAEKNKKYLSPKEVEKIYGLNNNTLASWRCQGKGPRYSKENHIILYKIQDIEDFLNTRRIKTYDQQ